MESKGLRVNMGKTKCMVSNGTMESTRKTSKYPCSISHKDVGSNSIYCNGCSYWVRKKCSSLDCEIMRSIGAKSAQVKLEFMMAHR